MLQSNISAEDTEIEKRIGDLPHWACVAFAVRCAIRVEPLFEYFFPIASDESSAAIASAVAVSWASADSSKKAEDATNLGSVVLKAAEESFASADSAANTAAYAVFAPAVGNSECPKGHASAAYFHAIKAGNSANTNLVPLLAKDLECLETGAKENHWDDSTPVSQDIFPPLWPDKIPQWFTEE